MQVLAPRCTFVLQRLPEPRDRRQDCFPVPQGCHAQLVPQLLRRQLQQHGAAHLVGLKGSRQGGKALGCQPLRHLGGGPLGGRAWQVGRGGRRGVVEVGSGREGRGLGGGGGG